MCERVAFLTRHHLIPRSVRNIMIKPKTVPLCVPCHKTIHVLFTNDRIKDRYDTITKLQTDPKIQEHITWVRKESPNILPVANWKSTRL